MAFRVFVRERLKFILLLETLRVVWGILFVFFKTVGRRTCVQKIFHIEKNQTELLLGEITL